MIILQKTLNVFRGQQHPPPPLDGISLITSGELSVNYLHSLPVCRQFDDIYTRLVHNKSNSILSDTEDSGSGRSQRSDSDDDDYEYDGYEYDDDIYGYMGEYEN